MALDIVLWSDKRSDTALSIIKKALNTTISSNTVWPPMLSTQEERNKKGKRVFSTEHEQGNGVHPPTVSCNGLSLPSACSLPSSACCRCLSSSSSPTLLSDVSSFAFISANWKASDRQGWLTGDPERHCTWKVPSNPFRSQKISVKGWIWCVLSTQPLIFPFTPLKCTALS